MVVQRVVTPLVGGSIPSSGAITSGAAWMDTLSSILKHVILTRYTPLKLAFVQAPQVQVAAQGATRSQDAVIKTDSEPIGEWSRLCGRTT